MIIIKIILGLFGLGIVVFVHELGHFLAARLVKIDVTAFSIGWGNPILKKKIGDVEYRLGMFPVGGYCKMKDETEYPHALENLKNGIKPEKGSYLAAGPAARILVAFAGPFFNLLFAALIFAVLWGTGYEITTLGNKITLASEIYPGETFPADEAGLMTGDKIIEIDGNKINYYHEIQENIALNPNKKLSIKVERDGKIIDLNVTPALEKSTGSGKIGISYWVEPVIGKITEGSAAENAGLLPSDTIIHANDQVIRNSFDLKKVIDDEPDRLVLEYERNDGLGTVEFNNQELQKELGISWNLINYHTPKLSVPAAIAKGVSESIKNLVLSVKSLRVLFMGVDLTQAVSGPVRITYMMGDVAAQSLERGFVFALRSFFEFIALISIALCIMNLLPLPVIDGGMIILFVVEMIRKKPAHPKAISVFQTIGFIFIGGLMIFALFGDIMYLIKH